MKRVSVTTLEKFRRYMAEVSSYDTEESLIESLKGIFKGNDKTKFGSAYHKIIEGEYRTQGQDLVVIEEDIFLFKKYQYLPALKFREAHPHMTHEIAARKEYNTRFGLIQLSGRYDGIEGLIVDDIKTKFKSVSVQEYVDSCQWKFYLSMLGLNVFRYDIFEIQGFEGFAKSPHVIDPSIKIIAHEPIECIRYDGMEDEIKILLNLFFEYIDNRGFWNFLKPAILEEDQPLKF